MMLNHPGNVLFPILVIIHLLWNRTHVGYRGTVQQILGALCIGTIVNAVAYPQGYSTDKVTIVFVLYGILALLSYLWAWKRRHPKPSP